MSRKDIVFDPRLFCYDDPATPGMRKIDAVKDYSSGQEETMIINPVQTDDTYKPIEATSRFQVKDSGKREQFQSGMVRDTTDGKVLYHLVADGPMLERWAIHLTKGAAKYEARNWMKAEGEAEYNRFRESAFRHFMQWYNGETDEDHGSAVFFNINGAEFVRSLPKEA